MTPCFAIIDANTLSGMALRNILWDMFNHVEVHVYNSLDSFIRDSNRHFVHFFVSSEILFSHSDEFETLKHLTIVMSQGPNEHAEKAGYRILDTTLPEQELISRILHIHSYGHNTGHKDLNIEKRVNIGNRLSPREKDVLALMVKGLINKEIAEELGISMTTVIFHRNNICEKLQTRSLGKLTIFAVFSGIVDLNEI
ncbi:MAG: helix-turn-helix transcriptional regulator [Bacteroidales bacterium]|nr:helix-turn-helix transcriptional regulator [Bacteroidales bacterium]MBQ8811417.1 helix-turn-helix transcriptional regulator [Bacteroidales bacterium]